MTKIDHRLDPVVAEDIEVFSVWKLRTISMWSLTQEVKAPSRLHIWPQIGQCAAWLNCRIRRKLV